MEDKYEIIIGLEVHVELNTQTKMFCSCSANYFGAQPNTHTCPVCLGLPGALPVVNQEAIEKCIKIGLALGCTQNLVSYFERKNYFYPDLAKGYQISQLVLPLNINGKLTVHDKDGAEKEIRINRAHQEEDTGKLTHQGSETLIDFNRSGVPLVEIVTEPDFRDPSEVRDYAKSLQQIFRDLRVSNADMEKGDMRLEANVSVRKKGQSELPPYRVELKNINSFAFMGAAVEYEVERQIKALEAGETLYQETRGWNEDKKETYTQRSKEEAHDYRYFPEPDLPALEISQELIEKLKAELPEMSKDVPYRLLNDHEIPLNIGKIVVTQGVVELLEKTIPLSLGADLTPLVVANFIINNPKLIKELDPVGIIDHLKSKTANLLDNDLELDRMVKEVIEECTDLVDSYKAGKLGVINALVGQVMKKSQGKANSIKVKEILEKELK